MMAGLAGVMVSDPSAETTIESAWVATFETESVTWAVKL